MSDDIGPLLVRAGLLTQADLKGAYEAAADAASTLVEQLVFAEVLGEDRLCDFFRERLLVPRVGQQDLEKIPRRVLSLVPREMAVAFRCLPLAADNHGNLALAMMDPSVTHAVDEVKFATGMTIYRVVAPASALAWALREHHGAGSRLAPLAVVPEPEPPEPELPPDPSSEAVVDPVDQPVDQPVPEVAPQVEAVAVHRRRAEIIEDVYGEDTPIPQAVPFDQTTGRVVLIDPRSLEGALTPAERAPYSMSEGSLRDAIKLLGQAADRDAVAHAAISFLSRICRRAVFFVVRRGNVGELAGFTGTGVGLHLDSLRAAVLSLERASTFRDIVRTRLPYRGPVTDATSRDFLIDALGWAPLEMLAVPLSVRERVVGVLYGDERSHALPDDHLSALARSAELALERVILTTKRGEP